MGFCLGLWLWGSRSWRRGRTGCLEFSSGEGSRVVARGRSLAFILASRGRSLAFILESLHARVLAELLAALSPVRRVRLLLGWPRLWPVEVLCEARQQMLRQRFSLGQLQRNLPLTMDVGYTPITLCGI